MVTRGAYRVNYSNFMEFHGISLKVQNLAFPMANLKVWRFNWSVESGDDRFFPQPFWLNGHLN